MRTEQEKREVIPKNEVARKARSKAQQIAELDKRLGVGVGAAKERKKLAQP